ncbi:hypothetical protein BKA61DRAFT_688300 [Leptodontidium sp. MPI-SDFR-AT-0119]|nr:hypothetical protein BKA61DRAFT_688300 [Leptodontidium sp. MPI-SDFR-AT-0119]
MKFVSTPTGFLMTLYGLNIVAWGAMLFFLLLGATPAMNHPSKDADSSPRNKWLEIDSRILNALFCVTGFGLAPNSIDEKRVTFTGEVALPTSLWKLSFVGYNRFDRPTWSTGTFIRLGCGVSLLAGVVIWWEERKVKKIEGPVVDVIDGKIRDGA